MAVDLFAGVPVTDYGQALAWYARLFGSQPTFIPNDTEAVWSVTTNGHVYIAELPERAGSAMHTLFVPDLDERVEGINARGIQSVAREKYGNGVRKVIYRDPDGNEIAFGGAPAE